MGDGQYDLEARTTTFGKATVAFCKRAIKGDDVDRVLVRQLVRSGTSIGANYREANSAESRADFRHKIGLCRKEANETQYWVEMIAAARPELAEEARSLWRESGELHLIFCKIRRGLR